MDATTRKLALGVAALAVAVAGGAYALSDHEPATMEYWIEPMEGAHSPGWYVIQYRLDAEEPIVCDVHMPGQKRDPITGKLSPLGVQRLEFPPGTRSMPLYTIVNDSLSPIERTRIIPVDWDDFPRIIEVPAGSWEPPSRA